jgi:hypothetical protein
MTAIKALEMVRDELRKSLKVVQETRLKVQLQSVKAECDGRIEAYGTALDFIDGLIDHLEDAEREQAVSCDE